MRPSAKSPVAPTWMAAIAALALVGAVLTPALATSEPASAADPSFVGAPSGEDGAWEDVTLGAMYVGVAYSDTVVRSDGHGAWDVPFPLPAGLSYSTSGKTLTISGTPRAQGGTAFWIYNSLDAGGDTGLLYFEVTVLPTPMAAVRPNVTAPSSVTPGNNITYGFSMTNTSSVAATTANFVFPTPTGISIGSASWTTADWSCSAYYPAVVCTYTRSLAPGATTSTFTINAYVPPGYTGRSTSVTPSATAANASPISTTVTTLISQDNVLLDSPPSAPYTGLTLTAYAPYASTSGTVTFSADNNGNTYALGAVPVSSTASATLAVPPALLAPAIGPNATVTATYESVDGRTVVGVTNAIDLYRSTTFAGNFYLNGLPFTDNVDVSVVPASDPSSTGAVTTVSGGNYTSAALGSPSAAVSYLLWARLGGDGAPVTYLTASGTPNATQPQASVFHRYNFTDDMDFYWELPATFSDATMDVPRQNVAFADGVSASSNVDITYSVFSGVLPTGLSLNPTSGAITGSATTEGQAYDFVVLADNGVLPAYTGHISGTVRPTHDLPAWTDSTFAPFRAGEAFSDELSASGEGPMTYQGVDGWLPYGITYDQTTGVFYGTPSLAGEVYSFTIRAASPWGFVDQTFNGTVLPAYAAPVFTDDELGDFRLGESFNDSVEASGEPTPTFTVVGDVPAGIHVDADGSVWGTPRAEGDYEFTITATNSEGADSRTYSGTVLPAWIPPFWTDNAITMPRAGVGFSDGVAAEGDGTINYVVTGGFLPDWLTLNSATGALTGTPTAGDAGEAFTFALTALSQHGLVSVWLQGTVDEAPLVALDLDFEVGDVAAGANGEFTITGAGGLADYDLTAHSAPVVLIAGTTSTAGAASGTFTIPSGLGAGAHSLVLTTTAADGTPRTFTVWFTIKADGTIGAISYAGPITYLELVTAGTDAWVPGALALGVLALGGILLVRRRKGLEQS